MPDAMALSAFQTKRKHKRFSGPFLTFLLSGVLAYSTIVIQGLVYRSSDGNEVLEPYRPHDLQLRQPSSKDESPSPFPRTEKSNNSSATDGNDPTVIYWRFDEAAPRIQDAKTHFLQSIPASHRLPPTTSLPSSSTSQHWNVSRYVSQSENIWPNKLHLFEMNPSIAVLPAKYREALAVRKVVPAYIASYRVTHFNNCFDEETNLRMFGGSWRKLNSIKTDYLGLALLHEDLSILTDTVVSFGNVSEFKEVFPKYNDYRIFNLHEELYLSTVNRIVPVYLSIFDTSNNSDTANGQYLSNEQPATNYLLVPPAFAKETSQGSTSIHLWIRDFASCPVYGTNSASIISREKPGKLTQKRGKIFGSSKNLLYFVDGHNRTMVVHYPRRNPNDVRDVELNTTCGRQKITDYSFNKEQNSEKTPPESFLTIDEIHFPISKRKSHMFTGDRGSACCIRLDDPTTGRVVFVGVAHPKTVFPGKDLPEGVVPNTYLSRFFAFETQAPYRIVARSGMFCLGYPDAAEQTAYLHARSPLVSVKMGQFQFAGESYDCPRIHFVTGIVDKVSDDSKAILSYGVSDCLSRVVEIEKSEIANMLWNQKTVAT